MDEWQKHLDELNRIYNHLYLAATVPGQYKEAVEVYDQKMEELRQKGIPVIYHRIPDDNGNHYTLKIS